MDVLYAIVIAVETLALAASVLASWSDRRARAAAWRRIAEARRCRHTDGDERRVDRTG